MPKLIVVDESGTLTEHVLDGSQTLLGRQPGADICLPQVDVSRSHALISKEEAQWYLIDLGSSNGTLLNGEAVDGKVKLYDQDKITIGTYQFLFEDVTLTPHEVTIHTEVSAQSSNANIYEHDSATKLRYVLEIAQELGRNFDLNELLPKLLERLLALFPKADRGLVILQQDDKLVVRAQRCRHERDNDEFGYSRNVVERVLAQGVSVRATEQQRDDSATIHELGIRSFLCVPLQAHDDRALGALQLDSLQSGRDFSEEDLRLLTAICLHATTVLENASLHNELLAQERAKRDLDLARLGRMVAGVAHEINNPLAVVTNNAVLVQRDLGAVRDVLELYQRADSTLAEKQPDLHEQIQQTAEAMDLAYTLESLDRNLTRSQEGLKRIRNIVEGLRDFARLDQSEVDRVDLNMGIQATLSTMEGLFQQKRLHIKQELDELPKVMCSPSRLNQVIFNLLHNASDACAANDTITVRTCAKDDMVEIHIIDTGSGMSEEVRQKLFDPFFTTKQLGKGVGLGLSLCHGIIQDHDGTIDVESEVGKGSQFVVRLPCRAT